MSILAATTSTRALAGAVALLMASAARPATLFAQAADAGSCLAAAAADTATVRAGAPRADTIRAGASPAMRAGVRGGADVVIFAAASAREVRFARQPEIRVRLCGSLDSVRVVERRNLPMPIVAGTTYRDVYIAVEILGHLDAACLSDRITARAARADSTRRTATAGPCASLELRARGDSASGGRSP